MQIPLLLNAIPRRGLVGPTVPVNIGKWRVTTDIEDSMAHIQCDSPLGGVNVVNGMEFVVEELSLYKVRIVELGSEKSVSVFIKEIE